MNKLPEDFKQKWVTALRGGEYKQGRGYLERMDGTFCCLGVACKIADISTVSCTNERLLFIYDNTEKIPALLWSNSNIARKLADMNDRGESFLEIADWIEENL